MKQKANKTFDTVTEAMTDLNKRGYTSNFVIQVDKDCLWDKTSNIALPPQEFEIDETYRFEGETDPGDEMIVYAISAKKHPIKGIVVNGYGMYADAATSNIMKHLKKHL